jgi:ketosteroid isomerase-like protein
LLGDSVGLALLVVLDSLTPAERVAFVLHDVFAVPFDDIAPIVGRTPTAARQLASRARRRVQGAPVPDVDLDSQWVVVDAFLAAAREGDFERLLAVLDPEVVVRSDGGVARPGLISLVRGARAVAEQAMTFRRFAETSTRILVNGIPGGVAWAPDGSPFAVLALTVRGGRIVAIDVLADPDRLGQLDLTVVAG